MTTNKTQKEMEATGDKDQPLPRTAMTSEEEFFAVCDDIIGAYKKLIMLDEPSAQKLLREMTKCFVSASAVVSRRNRGK